MKWIYSVKGLSSQVQANRVNPDDFLRNKDETSLSHSKKMCLGSKKQRAGDSINYSYPFGFFYVYFHIDIFCSLMVW